MLSRVAESIYWAGRYIERVENTARLIWVNSHIMMDAPKGLSPGWEPLISITGLGMDFSDSLKEPSERNIVKFLIGETENSSSIISSLKSARENFRTIREIIPRSAWESLNELYIFAKEGMNSGITKKGRDEYLTGIINGSQQLNGLISTIMYRCEGWHFLRIGRNIERAEMTTRIIDVQSVELLNDEDDLFESRSLQSIQWISILKSLSAYSIYRRRVAVRVSRFYVLNFLFRDTEFPRAFAHCITSTEESVGTLPRNSGPLKALRLLEKKLFKQNFKNMGQAGLHQLIDELQLCIIDFHNSLEKQYFLRSTE